jgi:hypothetical protein
VRGWENPGKSEKTIDNSLDSGTIILIIRSIALRPILIRAITLRPI